MDYYNSPIKGEKALKYIEKRLGYTMAHLLTFPKFFLIETTNVCNARCIMCGIDFSKKKKIVMSDKLFEKITDELKKYNEHIEKVMLYLDCEPLLDKKLPARIRKIKKIGVKNVNIASNASLLTEKLAKKIITAGLDEIYITIDSLEKKVFENIRKGLKFETVYQNIINFIKLRKKLNSKLMIRIQMILQELNRGEATSFKQHWDSLLSEHDQIVVQKAHNWGATVKTISFGDENKVNNIPCIVLWSTLAIHADGQTGLCCMDTNSSVPIGNVNLKSIAEIWSGNTLQNARKKHINGKRQEIRLCDGCTLWRDSKHIEEAKNIKERIVKIK